MKPSISTRLLRTQSDDRLLALARDGYERAFEALVQRYGRSLLAYSRSLSLPAARAEDAVQQGLLQAWVALQGGAEVREARPWLYAIVRNTAVKMLRTSGYEHAELSELIEATGTPELHLERKIAVRETLAGMSALPELQREALLQTAIEGRSHDQVAAALGISSGAVRGLIYRARATLRSAATALTPFPLVSWVARAHRSAPLSERLSEVGVGAGSVGIAGTLAKGGTVVVTVGVLAVGGAAVTKPWDHDSRVDRTTVVRHASLAPAVLHNGNATRLFVAASGSTGVGAGSGSGAFEHLVTSTNGPAGAPGYQRTEPPSAGVRGGGLTGAAGRRNSSSSGSQGGSDGGGSQPASPIRSGPAGAGASSAASGAGNSPTGTTTSSDGGDSSTKTTVAGSPAPGSGSGSTDSDGADSSTTPPVAGRPAPVSTPVSTGSDGADSTPTPTPTVAAKPPAAATPGSSGSDGADSSTPAPVASGKPAGAATPGSD
jgi:RNA polymerase sigma factor (sigma-70 family)